MTLSSRALKNLRAASTASEFTGSRTESARRVSCRFCRNWANSGSWCAGADNLETASAAVRNRRVSSAHFVDTSGLRIFNAPFFAESSIVMALRRVSASFEVIRAEAAAFKAPSIASTSFDSCARRQNSVLTTFCLLFLGLVGTGQMLGKFLEVRAIFLRAHSPYIGLIQSNRSAGAHENHLLR